MTIRRADHKNRAERWKYWVLAWVEIAEAAIVILSLGLIVTDWRASLLFSSWMDS